MRKIDLSPSPAGARQFARMAPSPTDEDYRRLLELRTGLRRFLRWSEQHAEAAGLTPAQHQLLLAIRGHDDPRGPTVGDVAGYLMLRHHSAVGLVDRAEKAGTDHARARIPTTSASCACSLTEQGARPARGRSASSTSTSSRHLAPTMHALWDALEDTRHRALDGAPHPASPPARGGVRAGVTRAPERREPPAMRPGGSRTVAVGAPGYACVPGSVPIGGAVAGVTLLAQSSPGS